MSGGGGGDGPENDIEGVLAGIKEAPFFTDLILIADNYSDVRDIELVSRVNKPVKIILCGGDVDVNEDYLNIAKATGGSIHWIEGDMIDLASVTEGSRINIKGHTYIFLNGKFIYIEK